MTQRLKELVERWKAINGHSFMVKGFTSAVLSQCISQLEAAIAPQWIPVGERLPESHLTKYYIWDGRSIREGFYFSAYSRWSTTTGVTFSDVTHWMPIDLPEPPGGVG